LYKLKLNLNPITIGQFFSNLDGGGFPLPPTHQSLVDKNSKETSSLNPIALDRNIGIKLR